MVNLLFDIPITVLHYLRAQWILLSLGMIAAVVVRVYFDAETIKRFVQKHDRVALPGAIALAALTPLCACGTMGVILALFVSQMPWGPVMAFLVTSPLLSPSGFLFCVSFLGLPFAVALAVAALTLGTAAGWGAQWLERNTSFLSNQFRRPVRSCSESTCRNDAPEMTDLNQGWLQRWKIRELLIGLYRYGLRGILLYFVLFIAIGQVVERLVPAGIVEGLFSSTNPSSVFLAAALGTPLYLSGPSALPLLSSLVDQGASWAAVLAFVIAGKATGLPVLLGMGVFVKPRVLLAYASYIFFGAILAGYVAQMIMS